MTDREFEALVARLQRQSATHPTVYRLRVLLLAALGYGFLVGAVIALGVGIAVVVTVLVALRIGAVAGRAVTPLATLMATVLKALWVRIPAPSGVPVRPPQAPQLFALLERMRERVDGPRIHAVLMSSVFNASIVQVPRLGIFGWQKNHLVLGLPLMQLVPATEFAAVLAHEMGHLAGAHGRFGIWVYRQRQSWLKLLEQLEAQKKLEGSVFLQFSRWYAPLFNAYTFVMARAHEYDADRLAAAASSPRIAADALTRVETAGRWVELEFWPDLRQRVRRTALPPADLLGELARRGREPADAGALAARLEQALKVETASTDTHPSFKARLEALGEAARPPAPFERSAAEELLGPALADLEGTLDRSWYDAVLADWQEGNRVATAERSRLALLDGKLAAAALSTEETWERACLLSADGRSEDAETVVERLVATAPTFAPAQSVWGMILLSHGNGEGLGHIDRALELGGIDPVEPCRAAFGFLTSQGRPADAERYRARALEYQALLAAAEAERSSFRTGDPVEPHGLAEPDLEALRQALKAFPVVKSAVLARKRVQHFPQSPLFVLGVRIHRKLWRRLSTQAVEVRKALLTALPMPGRWFCYSLDLVPSRHRDRFERAAGGPFYRAP
jgi:Zn-dependent protease with chaperone function